MENELVFDKKLSLEEIEEIAFKELREKKNRELIEEAKSRIIERLKTKKRIRWPWRFRIINLNTHVVVDVNETTA